MESTKKVLVVDDERPVNELVREALESRGYRVESAFDGDEALRKVSSFQPDAVILDVIMPGENGYRVSRKIKDGASSTDEDGIPKVLLLTGRSLEDTPDREEMFRQFSKADGVMYKPFELRRFLAEVESLLLS